MIMLGVFLVVVVVTVVFRRGGGAEPVPTTGGEAGRSTPGAAGRGRLRGSRGAM